MGFRNPKEKLEKDLQMGRWGITNCNAIKTIRYLSTPMLDKQPKISLITHYHVRVNSLLRLPKSFEQITFYNFSCIILNTNIFSNYNRSEKPKGTNLKSILLPKIVLTFHCLNKLF